MGEGFGATDNVAREKNKLIDWVYIDHVRQQDKKLIKYMNVGTIVDFMVENKKVKYGFKYDAVIILLPIHSNRIDSVVSHHPKKSTKRSGTLNLT